MVVAALEDGWLAPVGPDLDAFDRDLAAVAGTAQAVAVVNGTAALHVVLHTLGIGSGDDVFVPTLTFVATANAVLYTGATPRFVDADRATWCIDAGLVAAEFGPPRGRGRLPKAVVTVDLYGQCADYDPIVAKCEEYGIVLIEDAAEAMGATYRGRRAGSMGRAGVLSFNGNKLITTSGGGAVVSDDEELVAPGALFVDPGSGTSAPLRAPRDGLQLPAQQHPCGPRSAHSSSRSPERIERRRARKRWYVELFDGVPGVTFMPDAEYGQPINWLTCIVVDAATAGYRARCDQRPRRC